MAELPTRTPVSLLVSVTRARETGYSHSLSLLLRTRRQESGFFYFPQPRSTQDSSSLNSGITSFRYSLKRLRSWSSTQGGIWATRVTKVAILHDSARFRLFSRSRLSFGDSGLPDGVSKHIYSGINGKTRQSRQA